ncbi:MAG: carbohydrate binding domain-containing protein [Candidatus Omnitrophota bacterium]
MKIKILTLFLLSLILTTLLTLRAENIKPQEWFAFVIGQKLNPKSHANIGKYVLDAPAGKHGFTEVKDGHFYFKDGTRAKFWGTNLCFSACFPSKKQAEFIAERLAFFGFNAVRLHHMDFYFEPEGIFKDTCPVYRHAQMKKTRELSPQQLDKLDYLIYQLKSRGIYIDMNLLVSRHFTEADEITDADKLGMAAKPVSMFDLKLIQLQKKYAQELLTHYNKYTRHKYCDDPAIALIEITNENSIINAWYKNQLNGPLFGLKKNSIPESYSKRLNLFWNEWLKKKYQREQNVKNAWFSLQQSSDSEEIAVKKITSQQKLLNENNWVVEKHKDTACVKKTSGNNTILSVKKISNIPWHVQYYNGSINIEKNKNYLFEITAKANKEYKIDISCKQNYSPWNNLGLSETIQLTPESRTFKIPFTAGDNCANARVTLIIGCSTETITIENISLKQITGNEIINIKDISGFNFPRPLQSLKAFYSPQAIKDVKAFYIELEKKYFTGMTNFLKNNLNIKVPITGIGGYSKTEDILAQEPCDFLDVHTYWDHPVFPGKPWDRNNFTIHNKSTLTQKDNEILKNLLKKIDILKEYKESSESICLLKPLTISEWNHCYPNQYAYETPLFLAAEGVKNNWDGLFQFAFKHRLPQKTAFNRINSYFDIMNNPQQLILNSLASFIFLNNNPVLTDIDNGMLTISSTAIKAAVGFIKNRPLNFNGLSVTSDQDGVIAILKETNGFLITAISEVKNTQSKWINPSKFHWGKEPVLLKKMNLQVRNAGDKEITVYELNNQGSRGKKITTTKQETQISFSTKKAESPWFEITIN